MALAIIKQFADQVRTRLISQSINCISRVLHKLLRYFNGTIVSTSFVQSFLVRPVIFCLNLKEAPLLSSGKSMILSALVNADSPL